MRVFTVYPSIIYILYKYLVTKVTMLLQSGSTVSGRPFFVVTLTEKELTTNYYT